MRCEVTDRKGGVASRNVMVLVGEQVPPRYHLSGAVTRAGKSVSGTRVFMGDFYFAFTDSDGRFTLSLLHGNWSLNGVFAGAQLNPGFQNPVSLLSDRDGVNFTLAPIEALGTDVTMVEEGFVSYLIDGAAPRIGSGSAIVRLINSAVPQLATIATNAVSVLTDRRCAAGVNDSIITGAWNDLRRMAESVVLAKHGL